MSLPHTHISYFANWEKKVSRKYKSGKKKQSTDARSEAFWYDPDTDDLLWADQNLVYKENTQKKTCSEIKLKKHGKSKKMSFQKNPINP